MRMGRTWRSAVVLAWCAAGLRPAGSGAGDPYPLPVCVLLGTELDEGAKVLEVEGREVRLCCKECGDKFARESFAWLEEIDRRIVEQQGPRYPLTTCLPDGKVLKEGALNFVFRNRLFRVCDELCRQAVEQGPEASFAKLDEAVVRKQKAAYPLGTCVVSGKPLGEAAVDLVAANLLLRLAGPGQVEEFRRTPGRHIAKLEAELEKRSKASRPGKKP